MNRRKSTAIAALTASLILTACGGHGSSALPPTQNGTPGSTSVPTAQASFSYGASYVKSAHFLREAKFAGMGLNVAIHANGSAALVRYAQDVSNPKSPSYRKFLTPQEIGSRFGASQADYTAAATYFSKNGLHVGGWPQRQVLFVSGSQANLEKAFGTTFGVYELGGKEFIAPKSTPHFLQTVPVTAVSNLVTVKRMSNYMQPVRAGNNILLGYLPSQVRRVFDFTGAYNAGFDGTGVNVGIIGTGPIADVDAKMFGSQYHVKMAPITQVNATDSAVAAGLSQSGTQSGYFPFNGGLATPPPVTAPCDSTTIPLPACNQEDGEAQLDTQEVSSLAPGSNVLFYLAYNPAECFGPESPTARGMCGVGAGAYPAQPAIGIALTDDEIQQAIADNKADVLSLSYGGPESLWAGTSFDPSDPSSGFGPAEFAALATEGVAVFVSSGDSGAQGCSNYYQYAPVVDPNGLCVSYPAADANVTSVGGVTVPMDQFGNLTTQMTGWGVQTQGGNPVGSGGGISTFFPQPSWQQGIPGVQSTFRNQPDVSMLADNYTGVAIVANGPWGGQNFSTGGTSVAAPQMAAMWALVVQACKSSAQCTGKGSGSHPYRMGNAAPLFYQFYGKSGTNNAQYGNVFQDIVYGDNSSSTQPYGATPAPATWNQGYQAGPGYDLVTGLGVPYARNLIKAVTGV